MTACLLSSITIDIDQWLDTHITDPEQLKPLFKPYPSEQMEMYPVSDIVNSPGNDTPECIKSFGEHI